MIELDDWEVSGSGDIMEGFGAGRGVNGGVKDAGSEGGVWGRHPSEKCY